MKQNLNNFHVKKKEKIDVKFWAPVLLGIIDLTEVNTHPLLYELLPHNYKMQDRSFQINFLSFNFLFVCFNHDHILLPKLFMNLEIMTLLN